MAKNIPTRLPPLASITYNPTPSPLNCTTLTPTRSIASDHSHPFHLKTHRRLALFDPSILHFRVHCPFGISKKAVIRKTVKKTWQNCWVRELRERGWGGDGRALNGGGAMGALKGAVLVCVDAAQPERVLKAGKEEVRREVGRLVDELVKRQKSRGGAGVSASEIRRAAPTKQRDVALEGG